MSVYTIEVTERAATGALGVIARAVPEPCTYVRNGIGQFPFKFSIWDSVARTHLPMAETLNREIRLKKDGTVIWKGVPGPFDPSLSDQVGTMMCKSFEWYLAQIVFGRADRVELLTNPGFEAHATLLTGWTTSGTAATIDATDFNEGARSAKLDGAGHITQTVTGITHSYDPGLAPRLAIYVKVDQAVADGEGDEDFRIARLVADNGVDDPYIEAITLGDVPKFGEWVRVSCDILLAADQTWDVEVRLEGSDFGIIRWDSGHFNFNDATTVSFPGDDLAQLVTNIVSYAQDDLAGKYDLSIGIDCPDTSIIVLKGYAHADHENIWQALVDLCEEYGVDIWIGLDRILHLRVKRGTARTGLNITIDSATPATLNVIDGGMVHGDPTKIRTAVIAIGEGSDFAREEAGAVDTSATGGLILDEVIRAPVSAKVRDLQPLADETVARKARIPVFPEVPYKHTAGVPLIGVVEPGDTFDSDIDYGWPQTVGTYRVETVTVDPATDKVTVTIDEDL